MNNSLVRTIRLKKNSGLLVGYGQKTGGKTNNCQRFPQRWEIKIRRKRNQKRAKLKKQKHCAKKGTKLKGGCMFLTNKGQRNHKENPRSSEKEEKGNCKPWRKNQRQKRAVEAQM